MSAGNQSLLVRVKRDTYDELIALQQKILDEQGWRVSLGQIVAQLLADRKPVQP